MTFVGYEVILKYTNGRVWGFDENQHLAWKKAHKALDDEGVLLAFQKTGEAI